MRVGTIAIGIQTRGRSVTSHTANAKLRDATADIRAGLTYSHIIMAIGAVDNMRTCAILAAAFVMVISASSRAENTRDASCSEAIRAFDSGSVARVRPFAVFIRDTFRTLDDAHISQGEPGIVAKWSADGESRMVAMVIELCRQRPTATVYDEATDVYRGIRAAGVASSIDH